jgi:hypothetical protein
MELSVTKRNTTKELRSNNVCYMNLDDHGIIATSERSTVDVRKTKTNFTVYQTFFQVYIKNEEMPFLKILEGDWFARDGVT